MPVSVPSADAHAFYDRLPADRFPALAHVAPAMTGHGEEETLRVRAGSADRRPGDAGRGADPRCARRGGIIRCNAHVERDSRWLHKHPDLRTKSRLWRRCWG